MYGESTSHPSVVNGRTRPAPRTSSANKTSVSTGACPSEKSSSLDRCGKYNVASFTTGGACSYSCRWVRVEYNTDTHPSCVCSLNAETERGCLSAFTIENSRSVSNAGVACFDGKHKTRRAAAASAGPRSTPRSMRCRFAIPRASSEIIRFPGRFATLPPGAACNDVSSSAFSGPSLFIRTPACSQKNFTIASCASG